MLGIISNWGNKKYNHNQILTHLTEWLQLKRLTILSVGEDGKELDLSYIVTLMHSSTVEWNPT